MRTVKHLAAVGLVLLIFGGCSFACLWPIWPDRTIATFDLGDGFTLRIWRHDDLFDIDQQFPQVRYCVYHGSTQVFFPTYIGQDRGEQFNLRAVFADGGKLVCVLSEQEIRHADNILVFDLRTHESWPRHMHHDETGRPIPKERWVERFKKLADENAGVARLQEAAAAAR